jgi:NADH-quinone oxidoreductase subunit E
VQINTFLKTGSDIVVTEMTGNVHNIVAETAAKWRGRDGNLIMILHEIQGRFGYVPREVALDLSKELDVPLACIYEVITFYNYFKLEKPGKFNIAVCMGTACYLKGAQDILESIIDLLNIKEGETTPDGMFHLDAVRCLGCCGLAPVIMINDKIYGKVKKNQVIEILSKYKNED